MFHPTKMLHHRPVIRTFIFTHILTTGLFAVLSGVMVYLFLQLF